MKDKTIHASVAMVSVSFVVVSPLPPSIRRAPSIDCQEYNRYKDRLLKAENQLVNALGFDFMIEHPFSHSHDLLAYLCEEGKARGCQERKLCVLCSGPGGCQTSYSFDWQGRRCYLRFSDTFFCFPHTNDAGAIFDSAWRVPYRSIQVH